MLVLYLELLLSIYLLRLRHRALLLTDIFSVFKGTFNYTLQTKPQDIFRNQFF